YYDIQPALNYGYAHPDPKHPWEQAVDAPGPLAVRHELQNIMTFWMDKGIDGFRVDLAASLVKNDPDKRATIALWQELNGWFDAAYPNGVLIAEWFNPKESISAHFDVDFLQSTLFNPRRPECRIFVSGGEPDLHPRRIGIRSARRWPG
ncbi:MAG: alpha-amylase family glycosyl hydrolase, partial [Gemmatimonadaceae bacterium]